jgi:alginate O-acetyltransferase complex protein AlgI
MLFPTIDFAIFFVVVFTASWVLRPWPRAWRVMILIASYVFYGWWDWHFTFLLAASTIINQAGAVAVSRLRERSRRRWAMGVTIAADIGLLGWFKYYGFFAVNVANAVHRLGLHSPLPLLQVALPVGVSFFTFMGISYVVDVQRGTIEPAGWLDAAVYLSFFPHLVAGPIVRGAELIPQLKAARDPRRIDASRAAWLIMAGLAKKVVISSYLSKHIVDPVFAVPHQHSGLEVLFAIYGYAVEIYADFSGYTDIAIGLALLLGFRFPANFDRPYTARNLQDFWRRWHMTLSRWLRDYLYIPLGGGRGSRWTTGRNIMITMVLGGLWHGAAWTFVAWGALHGMGQVAGHFRRERRERAGLDPVAGGTARVVVQRLATFHVVCLGWIFFRADSISGAFTLIKRLFTAWGPAPLVTPLLLITVFGALALQYLPADAAARTQRAFVRQGWAIQGAILGVVLLAITTLGPQGVAPFIYYRF